MCKKQLAFTLFVTVMEKTDDFVELSFSLFYTHTNKRKEGRNKRVVFALFFSLSLSLSLSLSQIVVSS